MRGGEVLALMMAAASVLAVTPSAATAQTMTQSLTAAQAQAQALKLRDQGAEIDPTPEAASSGQPWSPPLPHKTLQLDAKGRWGVRLDMAQPNGRDVQMKDVQAGAYISFGPRIRVGGSVGLGDRFNNPQRLTPEDTAPRVHLETAFKF